MVWVVHECRGRVGELHALDLPLERRSAWIYELAGPAVSLGSSQPAADIDRTAVDAAGLECSRRRTGGGAVLLLPGVCRWVDVVIPSGDPLWDDDVGRAFWWVGEVWRSALSDFGIAAEVHRGRPEWRSLGAVACFAGIGSGEVVASGSKAVGVSQRRTRGGARFQCIIHARWEPSALLGLVAQERRTPELADRLQRVAAFPNVDAIVERFVSLLP